MLRRFLPQQRALLLGAAPPGPKPRCARSSCAGSAPARPADPAGSGRPGLPCSPGSLMALFRRASALGKRPTGAFPGRVPWLNIPVACSTRRRVLVSMYARQSWPPGSPARSKQRCFLVAPGRSQEGTADDAGRRQTRKGGHIIIENRFLIPDQIICKAAVFSASFQRGLHII